MKYLAIAILLLSNVPVFADNGEHRGFEHSKHYGYQGAPGPVVGGGVAGLALIGLWAWRRYRKN